MAFASQHVLQQFARSIARQLSVPALYVRGHLESCQGCSYPLANLVIGDVCIFEYFEHGFDLFAKSLVWDRNDCRISNSYVFDQPILDFYAIDVLAAANNHVLGSVSNKQIPLGIKMADVSCV
ncbi:unannotated protein [freshwater metagenome]|uniref:Unannotated protein n=1 Tax=freshwater metagenome TaxID=449393 RepID=A0A6J6UDQ4_9ZZZZ